MDALGRIFDNRLSAATEGAEGAVRAIIADVRERGDTALLEYTRRWDYADAQTLRVSESEIADAVARVRDTELWPVLTLAADRIRDFHERQKRQTWMDTSRSGEILGQIVRPLERVGVYVPGGTAAYPSTVLMAALPAVVAGVPSVAITTPPSRDTGSPPDATLAAAFVAGVSEVYAVGGAQAVAALAYGTDTIARVDKIVGPGNLYVNFAKRLVYGAVGIDMLAGPSEVAVLADENADADAAAADILTQAEHDKNSSVLIATPSEAWARKVADAITRQLETLPRAGIASAALETNSYIVVTQTLGEAAEVVSRYAPEHLHVDVQEPWGILASVKNAGAILIGRHSSAPLGDYIAGPSHTLPTSGCARFASPLNVDDFYKKTSVLYFGQEAAGRLAESAATFADFEGLEGHARAARRHSAL